MDKLLIVKTRFPDELHGVTPLLIGEQDGKIAIVFDANVPGFQQISKSEAEQMISDIEGVSLSAFLKIARYRGIIEKA